MNLPNLSLFQQLSQLEQTLTNVQQQHVDIKNELEELKKMNNKEEKKRFEEFEKTLRAEKDTEVIQQYILNLQEKEDSLQISVTNLVEVLFQEYITSGKYKIFVDEQVLLLQKEYIDVVIACSENTSELVSTFTEVISTPNKIRLFILNRGVEYILDPLVVQRQVVNNLLIQSFISNNKN